MVWSQWSLVALALLSSAIVQARPVAQEPSPAAERTGEAASPPLAVPSVAATPKAPAPAATGEALEKAAPSAPATPGKAIPGPGTATPTLETTGPAPAAHANQPTPDAEPQAAGDASAGADAKPASAEAPIPEWVPEGLEAEDIEVRGESMAGTLVRTVLVLGVVLAAIYLTLNVGLRRLMGLNAVGARGSQALVSVIERHSVGPRHALLVVRAGTDYLVVGQTEGGMSLLSKIETSQVEANALARAAAPVASPPLLSPFLQKLLARKGDTRQSPPPPTPPPAA